MAEFYDRAASFGTDDDKVSFPELVAVFEVEFTAVSAHPPIQHAAAVPRATTLCARAAIVLSGRAFGRARSSGRG